MPSDTIVAALVGGIIGFVSAVGVIVVQNYLDTRKVRQQLINAIQAAVRTSTVPAMISGYSGRAANPAEQFLPTFWRDLGLLGTYTQLMVVTYFTMVSDSSKIEGGPSRSLIDTLIKPQDNLLALVDEERKGNRQNIDVKKLASIPSLGQS